MKRPALTVTLLFAMTVILTACSSGNDYYHRPPYKHDGRIIDVQLLASEHRFVSALRLNDTQTIDDDYTAPPDRFAHSMHRFVSGYGGHPVVTRKRDPGDDNTALQVLSISCSPTNRQRVVIVWAWFKGAWRAWVADQRPGHAYPGC